jgi:hypothetical protein
VSFPNGLTTIGEYAFMNCSGWTDTLVIPASLTSAGDGCFRNCTNLPAVKFNAANCTQFGYASSSSYNYPDYYAFTGCSNLRFVEIGNGVQRIPLNTFRNCNLVNAMRSREETPPTVGNYAFTNVPTGIPFYVPCGSSTAYADAMGWSDFTNRIENFPYILTVGVDDAAHGTATITQEASCSNFNAVISATPAAHFHFTQWNDGNTDNPRTVTVTQDASYTAQFAGDSHVITVHSNNATMGSVSGGGTYPYGSSATLSATPAAHYHFVQWNDGNTDNPRTVTVTQDASYTAHFGIDTFLLTASANDASYGTVSGGGSYPYNTTVTLTATANTGHTFMQWSDSVTQNPRSVTLTENLSLTAIFTVNDYTVSVVSSNTAMGSVSGGGTYPYGTNITLTATANSGYQFNNWNDGNTDNPRTLTVTEDAVYTANFGEKTFNVTTNVNDPLMGMVTGGGTYPENSTATVTAVANTGYHFTQWSDGSTVNPRTFMVTQNVSFTAYFTPNTYSITVQSNDLSLGTVFGGGSYAFNTQVTLTATPATHCHFVQWSDGNTFNPRNVTVTQDATYTAQFAADMQYTVTVSSDDPAHGSVTGGGTYYDGDQATVTAMPATHYHFVQWNDGNTQNPRTFTVTNDVSYTAHFAEDPQYTITVLSGNPMMGTATGGGTFYMGESIVISAAANEHYLFTQWSDGNTQNPRTVVVSDNVTYTAYFSGVPYVVSVYSCDNNMGTVSGGGTFEYGTSVTVTATPNAGYTFFNWSNGCEENPYTFTVYGNINLIANFSTVGIDDHDFSKISVKVIDRLLMIEGADGMPFEVYDMAGKLVAHGADASQNIVLPATGIYAVRVGEHAIFKTIAL